MSAIPADALPAASPWRRALPAVLALVAATLWLYRETGLAMVDVWLRSDTFAHGILVAPISLWLIWRQRGRLAALTPRAQPWVLLPMAGLALLWFGADLVVVNAPAQFALVGLLIVAVPAVLGWQVARAILFPLLFLFFAVPFGEFMVPPMMDWTADFVVYALQMTGVPVLRDGLQFVIPSGKWSVVTECSGVRYLMASFMVGSLFAYLNYRSYKRRAVFMAVALVAPILANWVRGYMIVMIGHLTDNRLAAGVDHILYGWVFFGLVIFAMFMVGMRWAEPDEPDVPAADGSGDAGKGGSRRLAALGAGLAIVSLPHAVIGAMQASDRAAATVQVSLPDGFAGGWQQAGERIADWTPHFLNPSAQAQRVYEGPAGRVGVYLAYYRAQNAQSKLVNSLNGLLGINDRAWKQGADRIEVVQTQAGPVTVRRARLGGPETAGVSAQANLVTWRAYWVDGRFMASDVEAKIAGAVSRVQGHGDDGAIVVLFAGEATTEASKSALEAFARDNWTALGDLLARIRDAR